MNLKTIISTAGVALLLSTSIFAQDANKPRPKELPDGGDCQGTGATCVQGGQGPACTCWQMHNTCGDYYSGDACPTETARLSVDGRNTAKTKQKVAPGFTVGVASRPQALTEPKGTVLAPEPPPTLTKGAE